MNCEACDALLIDLVERELDETRAAEVRAHAETCESCARSLARLEGGRRAARELMRAEPPRLDAVMAAARTRAAEIRAAAAAVESRTESIPTPPVKAAPEKEESSWLDGAMRWLGTWATGPQVAMAALLVLMVGIGVVNLPQFRSHPGDAADGALVEADIHAESGPSALDPAQPLDLAVDGQRVALGTSEAPHDERPTTTLAATETAAHERETHLAPAAPRALEARDEGDSLGEMAIAELAPSQAAGRVEDGPLPDVSGTAEQQAIVLAPSTASATTPSSVPRVSVTPRSSATYDEVEPPASSLADVMPPAIHRQARALAAAGRCDEAVPRYRTLLAEHPDYSDAPRAMIELADCDRRLGRLDDAERWLARAETFPSVSADARRARARIAAERHAIDRPSSLDSVEATSAPASSY